MKTKKLKIWFETLRPRTLPLAISSSLMGSFIAFFESKFSWYVAIFSLFTSIFLQILSNLSNDYGDFLKKADLPERIGPKRGIHTNEISPEELKKAIIIFILFSLISGILLIYTGTKNLSFYIKIIYFLIGLLAIYSAIKYTIGNNPFGYRGLGDALVFIFFGLIGVIGTYYLHTHIFKLNLLLPSISIGLLSVGVLNINNIRDYNHDKKVNKKTLVVLKGLRFSKLYHFFLITSSILSLIIYNIIINAKIHQYVFLLTLPLLIKNVLAIFSFKEPTELNIQLKNLSITTFIITILFGIGLILN